MHLLLMEKLMWTKVRLVTPQGDVLGAMEKLRAHELGCLHEAFSVLVFNDREELLLQKRAVGKYHCGGLWTNSCCSHPGPDDQRPINAIAGERLEFEMGIRCELQEAGTFCYRAELGNGLVEHEYDHILTGRYNAAPEPNPDEAEDWCWRSIPEILDDLATKPADYTPWFHLMLQTPLYAATIEASHLQDVTHDLGAT